MPVFRHLNPSPHIPPKTYSPNTVKRQITATTGWSGASVKKSGGGNSCAQFFHSHEQRNSPLPHNSSSNPKWRCTSVINSVLGYFTSFTSLKRDGEEFFLPPTCPRARAMSIWWGTQSMLPEDLFVF